jgi:hypothetical protein
MIKYIPNQKIDGSYTFVAGAGDGVEEAEGKVMPVFRYGYVQRLSPRPPEEVKDAARELGQGSKDRFLELLDRLDDVHIIGDIEDFENRWDVFETSMGWRAYFASESYAMFKDHFKCQGHSHYDYRKFSDVITLFKRWLKNKVRKKESWEE